MADAADQQEQTIVISDLLSYLACKLNFTPKEKLLRTLRQYYSEKDINEAHRTLLASLPEKKSTRHGRRVKHPDPLIAIYDCFQLIPENDLPIFVCKNLNNVPELDSVIKEELQDEEMETEVETDVEQTLREEQKNMKSQIADIAFVVKQLKDQLKSISHDVSLSSSQDNPTPDKKRKEKIEQFEVRKKKGYSDSSKTISNIKKKGLAYLQSLIDEDEDKSDKEQSERESNDYCSNEELFSSEDEFDVLDRSEPCESISCEVVLKEEPEDSSPHFLNKKGKFSRREDSSPSKTVGQKVIYIKNEERDPNAFEDEENSIEITSASDYLGNLEDADPSSRVGTLDSVITISKNSSSDSIIIEKIEAMNGEGYYFKCQQCQFICNEEKMILKHECNSVSVNDVRRRHRRKDKSASNMLMCTICEAFVTDVVEYNEHMLDHYKINREEGVYECLLCTLKSESFEDYKNHLLEHSWKVPYVCDLCDFKSFKELRMRNHAIKHLESKGPNHFECLDCSKICSTRKALDKHKHRHKKNYDFKCDICGLTFPHRSALSQHMMNHTKERMFVCHICSYRYRSQHSLDTHVKIHFRDGLISCHLCHQKFKSKNMYRKHVLSFHEGVKPFKCDLCDETFIFKHTMLIHRKTHGSQFHICGYCNKKFKSPQYLKFHCAIHEGKNPFKCSSCDFDTSSKSILRKHMSSSHSNLETLNLLSCDDSNCSFVTMDPSEMDKHIQESHRGTTFDDKMVIIMEES